ncbi:MAG: hypothetical protein ABI670_18070 [Chloroflexota bacterium]
MIDTRHNVVKALQQYGNAIARDACSDLRLEWTALLPVPRSEGRASSTNGVDGISRLVATSDEALSMMRNGFTYLGGVVGMSVLVDEPGLIIEDMQWLKRMFGARQMVPETHDWDGLLLRTYAGACRSCLAPEEMDLLQDIIERAIASLTTYDKDASA